MAAPTVYNYSSDGEFLYASQAEASPLEPGAWLMPHNSTLFAPPEAKAGKARVFDGKQWAYADDFRGVPLYDTHTGHPAPPTQMPGSLPESLTALPPIDSPEGFRCAWSGEGWALEELPPPEAVTMRQARLALLAAGHLGVVTEAISGLPGSEGEATRIEWEYAPQVRRGTPLTDAVAQAAGLDGSALDALFIQAARI